ncbi:receptor like protein 13 [Euphorbia peplus]|nr:receptor like protein 13 [Euphorbia peplus]
MKTCNGCLEDEKLALLQLASSFNSSSSNSLITKSNSWITFDWWSPDEQNCCQWEGVECSSSNGRLIGLFIQGDDRVTEWKMNASLFVPFQHLTTLSLQYFFISGSVYNLSLDRLSNLDSLDLSWNIFEDKSMIASSIGTISSLKSLSLINIGLNLTTDVQGLCNLRNLEELYLNNNELSGMLPWCIANLTSLQKLDLSYNHFIGSISKSPLKSLTSLEGLGFSNNLFQVPLSLEPFFNHSKLKSLNGEGNHVIFEDMEAYDSTPKFQLEILSLFNSGNGIRNGGRFPKFLWHQHDLQQLDLSNIQLQGEFPYWLLDNNTNLQMLNLSSTSLSGPLHLRNHSHKSLQFLDLSKNDLNGIVPLKIGQLLPNLFDLNLSGNGLTGSIPSSFTKLRKLENLDLSSNRLSGEIPADLEIGSFYTMILSNNHFEGQIFLNTPDCEQLDQLRVDNNRFSGNIPHNLFSCSQLRVFDASNNHLSGKIPGWIATSSNLQVLDLSKNRFSGSLPELGPSSVREVYLSENMLQGSLGTSFYQCSQLMTLDLSHNNFSGTIPKWIGKLLYLSYLLMNHNSLEGEIPTELCNLGLLSLIDLSNNNLSGHFVSCIRLGSKYVKGEGAVNRDRPSPTAYMKQPLEFTTKSITYLFRGSILEYISGMDLSCNNFSGSIPTQMGNLPMIQVLNLSHNSLIGPIPESFSNLTQIESLDLSFNNLEGKIPSQLLQLNFLSHFNVAHNNLSGRTPERVAQFGTFGNTSYEGNLYLCGPPLLQSCSSEVPSGEAEDEEGRGFMDMDMEIFYVSCVVSYMVVLCSFGVVLYVNPYWRRRWFDMIEVMLRNCYYFIEDHVLPLFNLRVS